ncbi:hypothetical protein PANT111_160022 [Pantoea brenneri]|uniref:Uncharacterized protein n=1 Tax=Pantoea brenneri TaxID=472694 RepID=A0AAX3J3L5_9GAMM|nr:hypothetical protein PANT111_160022 [Pantoea brenneri]
MGEEKLAYSGYLDVVAGNKADYAEGEIKRFTRLV